MDRTEPFPANTQTVPEIESTIMKSEQSGKFSVKDLVDLQTKNNYSDQACGQILIGSYPAFHSCKLDSLRWKIRDAIKRVKMLKRSGSKKLEEVLNSPFLPCQARPLLTAAVLPGMRKLSKENKDLKTENKSLKRKNSELTCQASILEKEQTGLMAKYEVCLEALELAEQEYAALTKKNNISLFHDEIQRLEKAYEEAAGKVDSLGHKLVKTQSKLSKYNARNVSKREKRASSKITKFRSENELLHAKVEELSSKIQMQNEEINSFADNLEKARRSLKYRKKKEQDKNHSMLLEKTDIREIELEQTLIHYKERVMELETKIMNSETVKTFENGRYTNEIREVLMTLINECNVSLRKVNGVICTVLKGLTNKIPEKLPSVALLSRMTYEAKYIAQKHVVTELLTQADIMKGNVVTLHSDGTTKKHRQFENYQCTLPDGKCLSMGVHEVSSQSAERNLAAFKESVQQLATARCWDDKDKVKKTETAILSSIQCTMSDQGPSNAKFFEMLHQLRAECLPEYVEGWDSLSHESKSQLSSMCNYYCKLHLLMNFESAVSQTAYEFEKHIVSGKNPYAFSCESCGTKRLCKNASKGLTMTGSDQSGVGSLWRTYLDNIGEDNYLINIEHDRLNTLFYQAAAVYHHQPHITDFLSSLPEPNNLLKTLLFDVREKAYIAGIRALGILDKIVTGPYWRMLEAAESILCINEELQCFRNSLEAWGTDSSPLLEGNISLFPQAEVHKDDLFRSLFLDTDDVLLETYTQMCLELMCQSMLLVLERQAKDQLKEGKFSNPSDNILEISKSVPTTNMASERDFGQLDHLNKIKPSASITSLEAIILWTNNKTSHWLHSLPGEEMTHLLDEARQNGPFLFKKFQERQKTLQEEKRIILLEKQQKRDQRAENNVRKLANVTSELEKHGGLWRDVNTVKSFLDGCDNKEKVKALHAQISFHREVLKSVGQKELFQKSSKGKIFDAKKLEANLITIITTNDLAVRPQEEPNLHYRQVQEIKELVLLNKKSNLLKLQKQRIKLKIQAQRRRLDDFLIDPTLLVGQRVKHNIRERAGEDSHWLSASVTAIHYRPADNLGTMFAIQYDDVPEEHNIFPLLKDMKNSDLILM